MSHTFAQLTAMRVFRPRNREKELRQGLSPQDEEMELRVQGSQSGQNSQVRPALSRKLGIERKMKRSTEAYPRMLNNQQLHVKNYSRPEREKPKDLEEHPELIQRCK